MELLCVVVPLNHAANTIKACVVLVDQHIGHYRRLFSVAPSIVLFHNESGVEGLMALDLKQADIQDEAQERTTQMYK